MDKGKSLFWAASVPGQLNMAYRRKANTPAVGSVPVRHSASRVWTGFAGARWRLPLTKLAAHRTEGHPLGSEPVGASSIRTPCPLQPHPLAFPGEDPKGAGRTPLSSVTGPGNQPPQARSHCKEGTALPRAAPRPIPSTLPPLPPCALRWSVAPQEGGCTRTHGRRSSRPAVGRHCGWSGAYGYTGTAPMHQAPP